MNITKKFQLNLRHNKNLFYLYSYLKNKTNRLVNANTDLVLEGYPRCGNTFLFYLLKSIRNLSIAHHTHTLANIKAGIKKQIPVVVLIREPSQAISSEVLRKKYARNISSSLDSLIEYEMENYYQFYNFIYHNTDKVCLLDFEMVISKPHEVICRIDDYIMAFDNNLLCSPFYQINMDDLSQKIKKLIYRKEQLKEIDQGEWSVPKKSEIYQKQKEDIINIIKRKNIQKLIKLYQQIEK